MRTFRHHRAALAGAIALVVSAHAHATTTWTVGAGAGCDAHAIQDAIDLAAGSTDDQKFIEIASDQSYSAQAIHVDNQSLAFVGGPTECHGAPTGDMPIISGEGTSGSVFAITGHGEVSFTHLEITGGTTSTSGGGILFLGDGVLTLTDVLIHANSAAAGGGIAAIASGGTIDVNLNDGTLILRNTAINSGGGIALNGQTYLYAIRPSTLIGYNTALNGYGGGIFAYTPASITIGSPGYFGLPVVLLNTAQNGGGIALVGDDNAEDIGEIRLFTTDASGTVSIAGNTASQYGGGLYLRSDSGENIQSARLCAQDANIDGNVAAQGAALALEETSTFSVDGGAYAHFNPGPDDLVEPTCDAENLGAVHCTGAACNSMSGNTVPGSGDVAGDGAVVHVATDATLILQRMQMHDNSAGYLVEADGDNDVGFGLFPVITLRNCLTGANRFEHGAVRIHGDDNTLTIDQCTFAPDIINGSYVIAFDNAGGNQVTMVNTIVDEPGTLTLAQPGINQSIENILTNDESTLPTRIDIIEAEPTFVDVENRDYRQQPDSLGVDWAVANGGIDLDGNPRDVDLPTPNFFGPRDLGAYETQLATCRVADTIYCDGFEP